MTNNDLNPAFAVAEHTAIQAITLIIRNQIPEMNTDQAQSDMSISLLNNFQILLDTAAKICAHGNPERESLFVSKGFNCNRVNFNRPDWYDDFYILFAEYSQRWYNPERIKYILTKYFDVDQSQIEGHVCAVIYNFNNWTVKGETCETLEQFKAAIERMVYTYKYRNVLNEQKATLRINELDPWEREIINALRETPKGATLAELKPKVKQCGDLIRKRMKALARNGVVEISKRGREFFYRPLL